MPWIPIYITSKDADQLLNWLNNEEQVAFIVRDSENRLIAKPSLDKLQEGRICIWHIPSGPIPWPRKKKGIFGTKEWIDSVVDPWAGWDEEVVGGDGNVWFGSSYVGVFWLNANTVSARSDNAIGLSSFEWIGNHYSVLGRNAPEITSKWWRRLSGWIGRNSQRVPRSGRLDGNDKEIYAFNDAVSFLSAGGGRDDNP